MLVLNVTFKCKPGTREEFLANVQREGIDVASRAEEGNSTYEFYIPVDNEDDIFLLEKWDDDDAHALHKTFPHYQKLSELKEGVVYDSIIERYYTD